MDEAAVSTPLGDDVTGSTQVLLDSLDFSLEVPTERNRYRLTGIKLSLMLSLALWAAIGYGVWVAMHSTF